MDFTNFPENLMRMQRERYETNYALAKAIGVHQTTITNWQNGTKPQMAHLGRLAVHYGTTVDELLRESDAEQNC